MTLQSFDDPFERAAEAARALAAATSSSGHDVYVALGSGWAAAADLLPSGVDVPMDSLPGFATPSALGHRNVLRSLPMGNQRVLLSLGRVHLYEGTDQSRSCTRSGLRSRRVVGRWFSPTPVGR